VVPVVVPTPESTDGRIVLQMSLDGSSPVEVALAARTDLEVFGRDKRLLFALQLDYEIEDVHAAAEDALTDGGDDKACDLVFVDKERGDIVIAQSYEAANPEGKAAPESKAASLHQAVSWLLTAPFEDLPERLKDPAREVRDAISEGRVVQVRLWFVHNCGEGGNAVKELQQTVESARTALAAHFPDVAEDVDVNFTEVGPDTLASWYEGAQTPILVKDDFCLSIPSGSLQSKGDNWRAVCASVPATWLHDLYSSHGSDVFSANVRGYLGSVKSEKNINHGIKESAANSSSKFWAYNNGITAVVNNWTVETGDGEDLQLKLNGLAIVNGAQTTGALGSVDRDKLAGVAVLARFIKCEDLATVREIIRFNNRQNPTQAADFRSNDRVQRRLRDEFAALGVVDYSGGRRGGASDVIKRPADNMIAASVAAQALAAFHGRPSLAYHEKGQIWEDDATYGSLFSERTTAEHLLFVVAALKSIEKEKVRLKALKPDEVDDAASKRAAFLRHRGSQFLLLAGLGASAELLVGEVIADRFTLHFKTHNTVAGAVARWDPVVDALIPLAGNSLANALQTERGLRSDESVKAAMETFRAFVESTLPGHEATLKDFRNDTTSAA
jgi:hypothetical protein